MIKKWFLSQRHLVIIWLLASLFWWVRYHPLGVEGVVFDNDAAQHVYWTAKFQDPQLFPDDLAAAFMSSPLRAPMAYHLLYRFGTTFMEPLLWSQWFTLGVLIFSLWLLDKLVMSWTAVFINRSTVLILFLLYHMHNDRYSILGGFARTFSIPLLLIFCIALYKHKALWKASMVPIVSIFFYPPVILNMLALVGDKILRSWWATRQTKNMLQELGFLLIVTACIGLYLIRIDQTYDTDFGPLITKAEALAMPEFFSGGRWTLFTSPPWKAFFYGDRGLGFPHLGGFILVCVIVLAFVQWRHFAIPSLAWGLLWTSLCLFTISHLVLFRLYFPSRYTIHTLSLMFILTIGMNAQHFWQTCKRFSILQRVCSHHFFFPSLQIFLGLLLILYISLGCFIRKSQGLAVVDTQDLAMMSFLQTLPVNSFIAGHPFDLDYIPLFAKRMILTGREISQPIHKGYYAIIKQRTIDTLQAFYASDWNTVQHFITHYHISAFVINKNRLTNFDKIYYEPFHSMLKPLLHQGQFLVLQSPPHDFQCFENERYLVLCFTASVKTT